MVSRADESKTSHSWVMTPAQKKCHLPPDYVSIIPEDGFPGQESVATARRASDSGYIYKMHLWSSPALKDFSSREVHVLFWLRTVEYLCLALIILQFQSQEELCNFWTVPELSEAVWKNSGPILGKFSEMPD